MCLFVNQQDRWAIQDVSADERLSHALVAILKNVDQRITDAQSDADKARGFKYFGDTETAYGIPETAAWQIPSGYRKFDVVYGSGLVDANSTPPASSLVGVRVRLPQTPNDGDMVSLYTAHRDNNSTGWQNIFVEWIYENDANGNVIVPGTRCVIEGGVAKPADPGDNRLETWSHQDQRWENHWRYVAEIDSWVYRRDSY